MATAKRLYLYTVSAIGLGLVLAAGTTLLRLVLVRLGIHAVDPFSTGFYAVVPGYGNPDREALAAAIGMMVVGLPLWLIHWGLAERMVRGDGADAEAERHSILRSFFFAVVLGSLLGYAASSLVDALREGLAAPLGATDPWTYVDLAGSASAVVVVGVAWCYHAWTRASDLRHGPALQGPAAWISRLYLYGAIFVGLAAALAATTSLLNTAVDAAAGSQGVAPFSNGFGPSLAPGMDVPTAAWWVRPVLAAGATLLVWGWVWAGHWIYANRLHARLDEHGQSERASRVRLAFFVGVVALGVGVGSGAFAQSLGALIGVVVGAAQATGARWLLRDVGEPAVAAAFYIVAWWAHRRYAIHEQARVEGGSPLRAIRPMDYITALFGLGLLAGGLAALIGLLLQYAVRGNFTGLGLPGYYGSWRSEAARDIGFAVVGLAVLLWPWLAGRRRLAVDRPSEVRSSSRRSYLFLVVGASVVAAAWGLAIIVSAAARVAVGLDASGFGSSVAYPLAVLAVATAVAAFHGTILRREMAFGGGGGEAPIVAAVEASVPIAQAPVRPASEVVISGPEGADLEPLRAWLAATLPPGYSIAVRPTVETPESQA